MVYINARNRILMYDPIITEKVQEFADAFNCKDLQAKNEYLQRWKGRQWYSFFEYENEFQFFKVKKAGTYDAFETTASYLKITFFPFRNGVTFKGVSGSLKKLQTKLQQLCNIYNADEFVLFCEALPYKNLHFKGQPCSGGKHIKKRITGMAVSNTL